MQWQRRRSGKAPAFLALVGEPEDATVPWWAHHDADGFGKGLKRIRHARLGEIEFGYNAQLVANTPDLRLIIYTPVAGKAAKGAPALWLKGISITAFV